MASLTGDRPMSVTQTDLQTLFDQAQQDGESIYHHRDFETQVNLPRGLGEGCGRLIQLRHGLTLYIRNVRLWQPMAVEQHHDETFPVTAKFYLSGSSRVLTRRVAEIEPDYEETRGHHYLYHLPDLVEVEEWQANVPIQVVMLYAQADYFQPLSARDTLPDPLQTLMQGSGRFHRSLGKMSPAMLQILQQILHCPYHGSAQQLYLESKAVELFALQFDYLQSQPSGVQPPALRADDLERVHDARDLLIQQAHNPPSLLELSRRVGLNDRKLKQGFRQVFGTTVFGYLHHYRMQQAQRLLQQPHVTIAQVAATVGYRNPEAFSTAFRRTFAISPKAYQLGRHR